MWKYVGKRMLQVVPTTFGIVALVFVLFNVVGGSPAEALLGKNATAESIAAFNRLHGFDKPLIFAWDSQFVAFVKNLLAGNLGYSVELKEPVASVLLRGVGPSLSLTVPILAGGTILALMLAALSAARRGGWVDRGILVASTVLMSVNYVVWVLAGQFLLAYKAGLFPIWGYGGAQYLVLPVLIGIVSSLGVDVRFFRTAILDEIYRPYVLAARSRGLSTAAVLTRHVLRNALIPIVTYVSLSIPYLFTGSLLLESFFGIPGLGSVAINAIHSSDMAVVRGVVVMSALVYQFVNLATDLAYAALDPRVRLK
ncbi:MAG TPA: peptide ABC transporter permease [Verrucomicrobia bacterium]|nr:peptide ABC transporter permease [Verrucomicrobiota bacterium]HCG19640.1 peptide ABC transporter permease [Verrucomicrobiota bacterium]